MDTRILQNHKDNVEYIAVVDDIHHKFDKVAETKAIFNENSKDKIILLSHKEFWMTLICQTQYKKPPLDEIDQALQENCYLVLGDVLTNKQNSVKIYWCNFGKVSCVIERNYFVCPKGLTDSTCLKR